MYQILIIIFWGSVFLTIYTYAIYPMVLCLFKKKEFKKSGSYEPSVGILVSAYNEEKCMKEKIQNLKDIDYPKEKIAFFIASDGSSDRTIDIAKEAAGEDARFVLLDLPRMGKVNALNTLLEICRSEIIFFTDANTLYDKNSVRRIIENFADNRVGCVSGQLRYLVDDASGKGAKSESAYWKYENYVKIKESRIGLLSGANGAIYAIRNGILPKIPDDIINDDFYISTYILSQKYNVLLEPEAAAYEKPNDSIDAQLKRHIRDGAGHYQAMAYFWKMLLFKKGSFVYISHRVIKWLVPFFLIAAFASSLALCSYQILYTFLFYLQATGYVSLTLFFFLTRSGKEIPGAVGKMFHIVFYFFSVNLALFMGFINYITKKQKGTWETQR